MNAFYTGTNDGSNGENSSGTGLDITSGVLLQSNYSLNQESTGGSSKRDHSRANRTGNTSQCSAKSRGSRRSQQEKSLKRQQGDGSERERELWIDWGIMA